MTARPWLAWCGQSSCLAAATWFFGGLLDVGIVVGCQRGCITMTSVPGYKAWCHDAMVPLGDRMTVTSVTGSHQVTLVIPHLQAVAVETKIGIISTTWM